MLFLLNQFSNGYNGKDNEYTINLMSTPLSSFDLYVFMYDNNKEKYDVELFLQVGDGASHPMV